MTVGRDAGNNAVQISADWYEKRAYNSKERFCSYWHQIDEVLKLEGRSVLEVGPGGGLVTSELQRRGIDVLTLDIDHELAPDVIGSITAIPLPDGAVDVALAAQVLEHLPLDEVVTALSELARVSRIGVVVSVPDQTPFVGGSYPLYFGLYIEGVRSALPTSRLAVIGLVLRRKVRLRDALWARFVPATWALGGGTWRAPVPVPHVPPEFEFDGQHYWELGTRALDLDQFLGLMSDAGLNNLNEFRVPENPWHRFVTGTVAAREY